MSWKIKIESFSSQLSMADRSRMNRHSRKWFLFCWRHSWNPHPVSRSISSCQIHYQNPLILTADGNQRLKTVIGVIKSLVPHQKIQDQPGYARECNDAEGGEDQTRPLASKSYNSFEFMKPTIEQALSDHHKLTQGDRETSNTIDVIKVLHGNAGLGLRAIVRFLRRNSDVFEMKEDMLRNRIENLRSLKLTEGTLQRSISRTPQLLSLPEAKINSVASYLTGDLDFTVKELPDLFLLAPQVFLEPLEITEEKFQYIFFTMGFKQHNSVVRHGVMRYSISHIRSRHLFLERRGQYQLPDKKGSITIKNPKIRSVICTDDAYFCREVALCRLVEFRFFRKVLMAEDNRRYESEMMNTGEDDGHRHQEFADKLLKEMS